MRCSLALFFCWVAGMLSVSSGAQSVAWSHSLTGSDAKMATDASGNTYVATIRLRPLNSTYLIVDKFSPSGVLLDHDVSTWAYNQVSWVQIMSMKIAGSNLKILLTVSNSGSIGSSLVTVDTATGVIGAPFALITSSGAATNLQTLEIGVNSYAVSGYKSSDGSLVVQRRSLASDFIMTEPTLSGKPGQCVHIGSDNYIVATTFGSTGAHFVLAAKFGASLSFTSVAIPAPALGVPKVIVSNDGTLGWVAFAYNDGGATGSNVLIRPFRTSTLTFLTQQTVATSADDELFDLCPAGTEGAAVCGRRGGETFVNAYNSTSILFESLVAGAGSNNSGLLRPDANGNLVCLAGKFDFAPYRLYVTRLNPASGAPMNSFEVGPTITCSPVGATIDVVGRIRALMKLEVGNELSWEVAQIEPAGLSIPGPYTVGGDTAIGTLSLGSKAPNGGATFQLFSNNAAATVPMSVTVPAGATSQTFTINTTPVTANAKPVITARYSGLNVQANFDLAAPLIKTLTANPQSQYGGNNIVGTVTLTGKAPTGGKVVSLSSSNTAKATVPASTTLTAGSTGKTFNVTTFPTLVNASSVITATTGAVSKTVFIAIVAPVLQSATLGSNSIKGGTSTTMTVTLGSKAPSGYTVTLLSGSSAFVQLPSSYAIPVGSTTANVPVLTSAVSTSIPVTLVAYRGPYVKTMTLTLTP